MRGWLSSFPVPRCSIRSNHGSKHSSILASKSMKPAFTRSGILLHVFLATSYGLGWPSGFWSFVILGKSVQGCEWRMWWGEAPYGEGKVCLASVSPGNFVALHIQGRTIGGTPRLFPVLSPEDIQGFCRIQLLESPTSSHPGGFSVSTWTTPMRGRFLLPKA